MQFSFELLSVDCESVLSTEDSEWGAADGIRVYLMVMTSGGFHQVLVSGRELPPPDAVDNFYFVPGKSLSLDKFPPLNAGNWELTPPAGLSDVDSAMIAVIGVNEGLPFVAGGGGLGGVEKANLKVFEELAQKGAEKGGEKIGHAAGEAAGGAIFAAAWSMIEDLIEELNHSPECRGVAFCYGLETSMRALLFEHLLRKDTTRRIDGSSPSTPLGLVTTVQHPAGCGSSRYGVELRTTRVDSLYLAVDDVEGETREGPHSAMPVIEEACRPPLGAEMHTWPVYTDRTITITPSHFYASLKPAWFVNGEELGRDEGTLSLTLPVSTHTGGDETEKTVSVAYERVTREGVENLVLRTHGEDGNYKLEVALRMNFEGVDPNPSGDPWAEFRSEVVWVSGSEIAGDDAWQKYFRCVLQRQLEAETEKHLPPDEGIGKKIDPHEIAKLGLDLKRLVVSRALAEHKLGVH